MPNQKLKSNFTACEHLERTIDREGIVACLCTLQSVLLSKASKIEKLWPGSEKDASIWRRHADRVGRVIEETVKDLQANAN